MLINSGDSGSGGGGGGGKDVGKLTHKRLNRGLPDRKQGTIRNQLVYSAAIFWRLNLIVGNNLRYVSRGKSDNPYRAYSFIRMPATDK